LTFQTVIVKLITNLMKKNLRGLIALLLLFFSVSAYSQIFKGEVIGGTNLSQVDGDETYGFKKFGFNGGLGVVAPIHKNWSLSLETLYSQKGSKLRPQYTDTIDGSYKLILNYAEIPFMIQYTDRDIVSAGAGISWNRLVFVEEFKNGYRVDSVSLVSKVFDRDDWMAFGDVRLRIYKNLVLNARYSYSLDKIAKRTVIDSQTGNLITNGFKNNVWTFRLIYMINEKRPDKKERKNDPIND